MHRRTPMIVATVAVLTLATVAPATAEKNLVEFGGGVHSSRVYTVVNYDSPSDSAATQVRDLRYGRASDGAFVGDWDGDGIDTLMVRRGREYFVTNDPDPTTGADYVIRYGDADDRTYVGDWDGDGTDTLAVKRGRAWYITNESRPTRGADYVIRYGNHWDAPRVGDWDGDGTDTLAVIREGRFFVTNETDPTRGADYDFRYGNAGEWVEVGDWDGDGTDTVAVVRMGEDEAVLVAQDPGSANLRIDLDLSHMDDSRETWEYVVFTGDWDGDGIDTYGYRLGF
ncbi:hypothetical protein ATL40_0682 [Serinibacter salmoneus]|uniref:VCBS repeat protein n=1 Tax=Serinibacter salmoneus TaxID=556530 RepID=A0A2A9CYB1_9MICO|nr:hypothetical protein ATL40_0682 [Serinibacter salmoneus]